MENKGNTMKITYNKNPLLTTVELDEIFGERIMV